MEVSNFKGDDRERGVIGTMLPGATLVRESRAHYNPALIRGEHPRNLLGSSGTMAGGRWLGRAAATRWRYTGIGYNTNQLMDRYLLYPHRLPSGWEPVFIVRRSYAPLGGVLSRHRGVVHPAVNSPGRCRSVSAGEGTG